MRAYLPWYLVIGYLGATWAAALGVILLRGGQVYASRSLRVGGVLLLLGSGIGFFAGVPEIWTPGLAGTELSAISGLAIIGAWATFQAGQRLVSSLLRETKPHSSAVLPPLPSYKAIDADRPNPTPIFLKNQRRKPWKGARWIVRGIAIVATLAIWRWDVPIFSMMNQYAGRTPGIDELARWLMNDYAVPTALAMLAWAMWLTGDPKRQAAVLRAILAVPLTGLVLEAMSFFYFRPRPFTDHEVNLLFYHPSDSSFPSNAATVAWAIAVSLWTGDSRIGRIGMGLAAGISWARVYGGVHYPLDVVAGMLLGTAISLGLKHPHRLHAWSLQMAHRVGRRMSLPASSSCSGLTDP